MASSLLSITNKTIRLSDYINIPNDDTIRVVSIIGKARMGKSTFLNAMVNHIEGTNTHPFATQSDDNHCTRGINYYYSKSKSILLLDCQGLALEDSSHDPLLLLITYLTSDVIVFNERMMLQNEALKLLEPICTFMNYLDVDQAEKPRLFFRISDADLVKDPAENLRKVMAQYNDQYQSIRDTVSHLFQSPLNIVKTDTLDKATKRSIEQGDYDPLFANKKLGFAAAIKQILETLPAGKSANQWKTTLSSIVSSINNNEKITIDKLDVITQIAKRDMLEWEQTLTVSEPHLFMDIPVDGLKKTYLERVEPRIARKRTILKQFAEGFERLPASVKLPYEFELEKRLTTPIQKAITLSALEAEKAILTPLLEAQRNRIFTLTNKEEAFVGRLTQLLEEFANLRATLFNYYEPTAQKYEDWMTAQEDTLNAAIEQAKQKERDYCVVLATTYQEAMDVFHKEAQKIVNMNKDTPATEAMKTIITTTLQDMLTSLSKQTLSKAATNLKHTPITIVGTFRDTVLTTTMKELADAAITPQHTLVSDSYDGFKASIQKYEALYVDMVKSRFMKAGEDDETYKKRLEKEVEMMKTESGRILADWVRLQRENEQYRKQLAKLDDMTDDPTDLEKPVPSAPMAVLVINETKNVPLANVKCCGWWGRRQ
jgi:Guanylate-binding protein, N-terminal domain